MKAATEHLLAKAQVPWGIAVALGQESNMWQKQKHRIILLPYLEVSGLRGNSVKRTADTVAYG